MSDGALGGIGVAVTRGEFGRGPLSDLLAEEGATVLDWGTVAFEGPDDPAPFLDALGRLSSFDWICFSSPRAVDAVVSRVSDPPEEVRMAAVGPSTAASLRDAGWPVHRVPAGGSGKELVEAFENAGDAFGARVFLPSSAVARPEIPEGLSDLGARVEAVTAYRLVTLPVDASEIDRALGAGEVGVVTFASPSAMEGLHSGVGESLFRRMAETLPAVAMGSTTAGALAQAGWVRILTADAPDFPSMVDAAAQAARL